MDLFWKKGAKKKGVEEKPETSSENSSVDKNATVVVEARTGENFEKFGLTLEQFDFLAAIMGHTKAQELAANERHDRELGVVIEALETLTPEAAHDILVKTIKTHERDRNFPEDFMAIIKDLTSETSQVEYDGVDRAFAMRACGALINSHSAYPEVRSAVDPWDDVDAPCETFRMYIVGIIWLIIASGVNYFFGVRNPSLKIQLPVLQMFMAPSGWLLYKILPDWGFTFRGTRHTMNPGPWHKKEQACATILASMSGVYADSQLLVQKLDYFYGQKWVDVGYQILLMLSTQLIGFGISGMFRQLLVYPTECIWYENFPTLAINQAMMQKDNRDPVHGWRLTRWQWFGIISSAVFVWEWVTQYLFSALQFFNWMCWIAPNNFNLATITGGLSGLGFNPVPTFDINVISANGFFFPVYTIINYFIGAVISSLIIVAVYWTNMYNTAYLPCTYNTIFTNEGKKYDVKKILTDNFIDREKYESYSPAYYGAASLVGYGVQFALYTCAIVWSLVLDGKLWVVAWYNFFKSLIGRGKGVKDFDDPHSRMMSRYKETPQWWFMVILLVSIAMGIICVEIYPTGVPVWGIFMGLGLSIVFLVPNGLLMATTNTSISLNVLTEIIIGYATPGNGVSMMTIKVFGVNTHAQALRFLQDLKFSHYTKVPPRSCFRVQVIGTIICVFVILGVFNWQLSNIEGLCTPELRETTKFTCPGETTYFSSSVIFGVIGPKRIFESQYPILKWCFLIGCGIPLPFLALRHLAIKKGWSKIQKFSKYAEPSILLIGMYEYIGAKNLSYITPTLYVSLAMMLYVKKRFLAWFQKYSYVTAGAFDTGIALSTIIIFFSVQYHPKKLKWWGTTVQYAGIDGTYVPLKPLPEKGYFGPGKGDYYF